MTECIEWPWTRTPHGYGQFYRAGRARSAHRVVFERYHRALKVGEVVRHTCHNPSCVNPAHLTPGTHKDNMRDMTQAGRQCKGARHPLAVLTDDAVRHIRESGLSLSVLARELGASRSVVARVRRGEAWVHVR